MWIDIPAGFMNLLNHPRYTLAVCHQAGAEPARSRDPSPARQDPRRIELDQRHGLRGRQSSRLRHLGPVRQLRLVVRRRAALFKKSEHYEPGGDGTGSRGGPLNVAALRERAKLADAFIDAAVAEGFPRNPDYNNGNQEGFG